MTSPDGAGGKDPKWPRTWPALIAWLLTDWGRTLRLMAVLTTVIATTRSGGHAWVGVINDLIRLIK